jgi:hypothetical protein
MTKLAHMSIRHSISGNSSHLPLLPDELIPFRRVNISSLPSVSVRVLPVVGDFRGCTWQTQGAAGHKTDRPLL